MKNFTIIGLILLFGCGPSREELEKSLREGKPVPGYDLSDISPKYRILKIEGCDYIIYNGTILHKANCSNHIK